MWLALLAAAGVDREYGHRTKVLGQFLKEPILLLPGKRMAPVLVAVGLKHDLGRLGNPRETILLSPAPGARLRMQRTTSRPWLMMPADRP